SNVLITGGTLAGTGTIAGNVANQSGNLMTGSPLTPAGSRSQPANLRISGNYTQLGGATLTVNSDRTGIDTLTVSGTAALAGTLVFAHQAGPKVIEDDHQLIIAGSVSGLFDTLISNNQSFRLAQQLD